MKFILYAAFALLSVEGVKINKKEKPFYGGDFFHAPYHEFPGTVNENGAFAPQYDRVMPVQFKDKHLDDMFMHSMIKTYAKELRNPDTGEPTGKFYLDKTSGAQASQEILNTHLHLSGEKL